MVKHTSNYKWGFMEGPFTATPTGTDFTGFNREYKGTTTTLPLAHFKRDRSYGALGDVLVVNEDKEHIVGSFPMACQTDTWVSGAVVDQNNVGGQATEYSIYWDDGITGFYCTGAYINKYTFELTNDTYPQQTVEYGYRDTTPTATLCTVIPSRSVASPKVRSDCSLSIGTITATDIKSITVEINPNIDATSNATEWNHGYSQIVNKEDVNLKANIVTVSADTIVYDKTHATITQYNCLVDMGIGNLELTGMYLLDCKMNEVSADPKIIEYEFELVNGSGFACKWST